jgi:hypothetical protein
MASQSTSCRGRPKAAELFSNHPGPSRKSDISLYVSGDGQRVEQDFTSPKKKCRVAPSALDDDFASWVPGIRVDDDMAGSGEDATVHVVGDPEALGKRKRYLSSVRSWPLTILFFKVG